MKEKKKRPERKDVILENKIRGGLQPLGEFHPFKGSDRLLYI